MDRKVGNMGRLYSFHCMQTAMEFIDFAMAVRSIGGGVESKTKTAAFERFRKNTATPIFTPEFKRNETKGLVEKGESWVENWMTAMFPILMDKSPEHVREAFLMPYRAAVQEIEDDGMGNFMYDSDTLSHLLLLRAVDALFDCEKRQRGK